MAEIEVRHWRAKRRDTDPAPYTAVDVHAGNRGIQRVVPPAGEKYAYDRQVWARHVQVVVSPTGRSVRVFVDGEEVRQDGSRGGDAAGQTPTA